MFEHLRRRLLIVNMLIIGALILASLGIIYVVVSTNTHSEMLKNLNRSIDYLRRYPPVMSDSELPENIPDMPAPEPTDNEDVIAFKFDSSGEVTAQTTMADQVGSVGIDKLKDVASDILNGSEDAGQKTVLKNIHFDFMRENDGDVSYVALCSFETEHRNLNRLMLELIAICVVVIIASYFISLYNANSCIEPIEESYNKQKQFVADASHELKTPLATINTNIDVVLSHGESTVNDEKKWLTYIKAEVQRMAKLTNDLLYLARLTHDENEIFSRVSFSENIENVVLTMEAVAFEKEIIIDEDIAEDVYVNASDAELKQLVMIFLDNAIKYTPKAGTVKITLTPDGVLRVRNSGEGISEKDQKLIFERFYRTDEARDRKSGGYGLGLAIAKALCEKFYGTIEVSSKKGEYTEFSAHLPVSKDA